MRSLSGIRSARGWRGVALCAVLAAVVLLTLFTAVAAAVPPGALFNRAGNVLIADQFNNRVIELSGVTGRIVWHFGNGAPVAGPHSVVGTNDAQRIPGGRTLIAGTGAPPASQGEPSAGVADNRVFIVNRFGKIVWQYGKAGVTGAGPNELNTPVQNTFLPNGHILITDQGNQRVIEVTMAKKIVWQYGQTGVAGTGPDQLNNPNSAELLANGHILIADENNNRVIEVTRAKHIVWQYPTVPNPALLSGAAFASRLANGHTLITDSNNNRIIEVTKAKAVVWTYVTNARKGSNTNPLPTRAVRLRNGNTLISDQFNDQVIEVSRDGTMVWSFGVINLFDNQFEFLNAPYDAKVIGDYTGLTKP
jgi:outer membrane protein assembly factor BamB